MSNILPGYKVDEPAMERNSYNSYLIGMTEEEFRKSLMRRVNYICKGRKDMEVEAKMRCVGAGALLYMGDVTIDGMITLHGCKILCVNDKMVCALPSLKTPGGWERPVRLPPSVMDEVRKAMLAAAKEALLIKSEFTYEYQKRGNGGMVLADVTATHNRTGVKFENLRLCQNTEGKYFVGYPCETLPNGRKRPVFELLGEAKRDFEINLIYQYDMDGVRTKIEELCPEDKLEAAEKEETENVGGDGTDRRGAVHGPGSGGDNNDGRQPDREHPGPGRKGHCLRR